MGAETAGEVTRKRLSPQVSENSSDVSATPASRCLARALRPRRGGTVGGSRRRSLMMALAPPLGRRHVGSYIYGPYTITHDVYILDFSPGIISLTTI